VFFADRAVLLETGARQPTAHQGFGKIILLGEHAVVYGHRALAVPTARGIAACVSQRPSGGVRIDIPAWCVSDLELAAPHSPAAPLQAGIKLIMQKLALAAEAHHLHIGVQAHLPRGAGLGASAALAVALIRAFDATFHLKLTAEQVNDVAFASEMLAHGNASGIDNTLATYGRPLLFQTGAAPTFLQLPQPLHVVLGFSGPRGNTAAMVATVYRLQRAQPQQVDLIFAQIDALAVAGTHCLQQADTAELGRLMDANHGLLQRLGVSTPQLDALVSVAKHCGALGAKLTGSGGGGAMVALFDGPKGCAAAATAMQQAGYETLTTSVGG
jgi:hydroxymethylglutaryl-CoA reductase